MSVTRAMSLHSDVGWAGCAGYGGFVSAGLPPVLAPSAGAGARAKRRGQSCKPRTPAQDHVPTL
jgi:hypothetical protein